MLMTSICAQNDGLFFLSSWVFLQKGDWDSWQEDGRLGRGRQWVACNSWMLYRIGSYPWAHEPARRGNQSFKESSSSLPTDANTTQCCCRLILNEMHVYYFSMLNWVRSSMKWYEMFLIQISTWPPSMHQKLTEHGRFCEQNNQLPT